MPSPNKKARFALAQRPAGSKLFSQGILLDIKSLQADPTYISDINDPDSEDNHLPTGIAALFNNEDLADNDSEGYEIEEIAKELDEEESAEKFAIEELNSIERAIDTDVETRLDTTLRSTRGIRRKGGRRPRALTYQQAPYSEV
jgi:hypothetical protein